MCLPPADAAPEAAPASARDPAAGERLLESTLAFIAKCQAAAPLARELDEDATSALAILKEVEATVAALSGAKGDRGSR